MNDPKVSVLIVTYNSASTIGECLASVLASSPDIPLEILVWDNSSQDGTVDFIKDKFPSVKVIPGVENIGFGAGNNQLLGQAGGEFVLFLNPDAQLGEKSLTKLVEFLQTHPAVGAVGPAVYTSRDRFQISWGTFPGIWNEFMTRLDWRAFNAGSKTSERRLERKYLKEGRVPWLSGACILAPADAVGEVGGFDPNFFLYSEDVDLCRRLSLLGYQSYFLPSAAAKHLMGQSVKGLPWQKELHHRRSQLYYYWKWKGGWELALLKLYLTVKFKTRALLKLLTLQHDQSYADFHKQILELVSLKEFQKKFAHPPPKRYASLVNWAVCLAGKGVFHLIKSFQPPPDINSLQPGKILFIKFCCLGDILFTTPAVRGVRKKFPKAELVYLSSSFCQPVLKHNPDINRHLLWDTPYANVSVLQKLLETAKFVWKARRERFEVAINFHRDYKSNLLTWFLGTKIRIGLDEEGGGFSLTHPVKFEGSIPEIKRFLKLAEVLGAGSTDYQMVLQKGSAGDGKPAGAGKIALAPGGGKNPGNFIPIKRWPYFPELIQELARIYPDDFLILGDQFDQEIGEKIISQHGDRVKDLIGKTKVEELFDILSSCRILIANDSGILHVASALGIPTLGIYGPTSPRFWAPLSPRHLSVKSQLYCSPCLRPDTIGTAGYLDCWTGKFDCMKNLEVEKVVQAVQRLLNSSVKTQ